MATRRDNQRPTLRDDAMEASSGCGANQIRVAARQITRFLDGHLRSTGLSIEQFNLLTEIAASIDDSVAALSAKTCIEISTLSRNLRFLESKGLVEIAARGPKSRRRLVWLTETGARRLEAAMSTWRSANKKLQRRIDLDQVRMLAANARRLKTTPSTH